MKLRDLNSMSLDQLWALREQVCTELNRKIPEERARIEGRLRELQRATRSDARRPYPRVFPKFRNPTQPSETWAGRGKKPRWLSAELELGKQIDDFRISAP
jgi:DNA-binding protein H-NS